MARKEDIYRWIKLAGFAWFIPVVLIAGPLAGYFIGSYLEKVFSWNKHTILISTIIGLLAGLFEAANIIKAMIKEENRVK